MTKSTYTNLHNSYDTIAAKETLGETVDKRVLVNIELVITILFLLYFAQAFFRFPALNQFFAVVTYIPLPYIIFKSLNRYLYFSTRDIFILLLIVLAGCSILWSPIPMHSFHHFRGMFRLAAYGIYFAMRYSLKDQIRLLGIAFGISAVAGLFLVIILPSIGIDGSGFWRGSFPHKNDTARVMVLSLITQLAVISDKSSKSTCFSYIATIASFILLIFAKSSTSLVVLFTMALLLPLVNSLRQNYKIRTVILVPIILLFIFAGTAIAENYELIIVDILGKDLTLNGRTDLWEPLFERIREKPLLGFGYNAFWETEFEWVAANKAYGFAWTPTHAHSGFLDLTLSLGISGLVLFLGSLFFALIKTFKFSILSGKSETIWLLQFLIIVLIYNLNITQSILAPENIVWLIYMAAVSRLHTPSGKRKMLT